MKPSWAQAAAREQHLLQRLVACRPRVDDEHADAYLGLLDRALIDRHISVTKGRGLVAFAREVGLGREQVVELTSATWRRWPWPHWPTAS